MNVETERICTKCKVPMINVKGLWTCELCGRVVRIRMKYGRKLI